MRDLHDPYRSIDKIIDILKYRGRADLAHLLSGSYYMINESDSYGSYLYSVLSSVEIYASLPIYEKLNALSNNDKKIILNAFLALYPLRACSGIT